MSIHAPSWTAEAALLAVLDLATQLDKAADDYADIPDSQAQGEATGYHYCAERIRQVVAVGTYPDESIGSPR